ncbi:hypothetical protein QFC22_000987 [Naganishia vaughanmartiniae]|uniref:Uncharacterized protein n=1 Tax=Naganishia vaughanmartiniae TaxID=1424756 RepID=A0ACC2XKQ3_9TREE|nr:hypothetical protein QFC22_000987 [Naganishia vaughanmartiniae]
MTPSARAKVLPWIQDQIAPLVPTTEHSIAGGHDEPLVSAAEFHNREVGQRHAEQTLHHKPIEVTVEHQSNSLARAVERQSWMDAQSVERERLEEEYENESRVHAVRNDKGRSPAKVSVKLDETPVDKSARSVEIDNEKDEADRVEIKGKEAKDRSKKKDRHHRHKHRHSHRKHGHKDKHDVSPKSANSGMKGENGATRSPERSRSRSTTAPSEIRQADGTEGTKPLPAKPSAHSALDAPAMTSAPWDLPSNMNTQGMSPIFYPPIPNSAQAARGQQFHGPAGMPVQSFAWGARAQQVEPPQGSSRDGNPSPAFTVPQYYGQSSAPSFPQKSNGNAPPVIHDETCSPRTVPNARFPFPPFASANQMCSSSEQMPNSGFEGHPHNDMRQDGEPRLHGAHQGYGGQWPMGMPSGPFADMPYGAYFAPADMPVPAALMPADVARAEQGHAIPVQTAKMSGQGSTKDTASARTEQEEKGESDQELERLRRQMKRNAEESRKAIDEEKTRSDLHGQRSAALAKLAGSRRTEGKQRAGNNSDRSDVKKRSKPGKAGNDPDPTYVETPEGFIKTYERVEVMSEPPEQGSSTPASTKASSKKPQPRRMTQQTQKTVATQPTFTSDPSFGHFGRPFSHDFEDGTSGLHSGFPIDPFPVDPARIVIMQRTVDAKPGFGIPVSALGGFGIGMGIFSPFEEQSEDDHRDEHCKRSAYVETVSDKEDPGGGHSQNAGHRACPEVAYNARREHEQASGCQQDLSSSEGDETPRTSAASLQGSLVLKEAHDSSTTITQPIESVPPPNPKRVSQALTTASLVDQLVQSSHHHDETLCQLLMAARDPKLGDAAKRAVRHAARDRVMRLTSDRLKLAGPLDGSVSTYRGKDKPLPAQPREQEAAAPAWSQALFEMLAETQNRLDELDARLPHIATRENTDSLLPEDDFAETQARAALHNLLFPDLPMEIPFFVDQYGNPHTSHHLGSSRNHVETREFRGRDIGTGTCADAKVETVFTDGHSSEDTARERNRGANITESKDNMAEWVSNAELPDRYVTAYSTMDPPPASAKAAEAMPTIRIQSPTTITTSNAGVHRSIGAPSPVSTQMAPHLEHEQLNDVTQASRSRVTVPHDLPPPTDAYAQPGVYREPHEQTKPDTAMERMQRSRSWDIVGQRLFSWALVWPAEDFYRSLKTIALDQQVDEFALTIYMMTIFKSTASSVRQAGKSGVCLPTIAEALNLEYLPDGST